LPGIGGLRKEDALQEMAGGGACPRFGAGPRLNRQAHGLYRPEFEKDSCRFGPRMKNPDTVLRRETAKPGFELGTDFCAGIIWLPRGPVHHPRARDVLRESGTRQGLKRACFREEPATSPA